MKERERSEGRGATYEGRDRREEGLILSGRKGKGRREGTEREGEEIPPKSR